MINQPAQAWPVTEPSQIAAARRGAVDAAKQSGLDETDAARAAIIATELATNLLKHGGGGEILISRCAVSAAESLEIIALDQGPGMADVDTCLRDGYSTAGSAGAGLGAVRRQSHVFDIFSSPGRGTGVLSRLRPGRVPEAKLASWPVSGGLSLPLKGETECGDGWAIREHGGDTIMLVADGLGHGPIAAAASRAAIVVFEQYYHLALEDLAGRLHDALRATRGAALAVARIDAAKATVHYVGIGNIVGTLITAAGARKMISHNGTAGHVARKIQRFSYDFHTPPLVVMHSDGLATSWSLDRYPGLISHHPALLSAILYRDFSRGRDDVSVIAATLPAAALPAMIAGGATMDPA